MLQQTSAFEPRIRDSFARQRLMQTLGASRRDVSPGEIESVLPFSDRLTQQHGFLHAAVTP